MSNPLYGLQLEQILTEISEQYGWECLSETLNIERFQFHTGYKSTIKFLRNNEWAKDKVEDFYLYVYKGYAWPDDKQLVILPRNRNKLGEQLSDVPLDITPEICHLIEDASRLRSDKVKDKVNKKQATEPDYDPANPWNN